MILDVYSNKNNTNNFYDITITNLLRKMANEYKFLKEIDCKQGAVRAVRFSVDGAYCIKCGSDRKLRILSNKNNTNNFYDITITNLLRKMANEYKFLKEIDCKQGAVRAVRFSVDGAYCITCGSDRKLRLWNPYRNVSLKTYAGHGDEVMDANASCDSSQIVSCGLDKSVIIWDVATGTPVRRLRGHAGAVTTVRFNEESSMVISGSRDNSVMCWDIRSRSQEAVQSLNDAKDSVSSVRVSDYEILTSSFDGKIRRYDIRVGEMCGDYMGDAVTCASFTKDGQCILASCADAVVRLLDKDTGELLGEFTGHSGDNLCLESSVDYRDTRILSGSGDGKLWIWDLATQRVIAKLAGYNPSKHPTVSISVHPQKDCFLATNGQNVLMWSTSSSCDE